MTVSPFERVLGRLLGIGIGLSTTLLASGLVFALIAPGDVSAQLLNAGLLVLMATPATRVLLACGEFLRTREWFFALASIGVLGVLAMTVWIAVRGSS